MKHFPRLSALALAVMLTSAACSGNSRHPIYYPGGVRPSVGQRDGTRSGTSAQPNKNKSGRDQVRCNAGNGNGNGNGRCRNGNRGKGNGRHE
jgi:hypothetical protein